MIRLFASDIDHTLYSAEQGRIPEENIAAIEKLQQEGVTIALASGRFVKSILPVANQLHLFERGGYIIACNGAVVIRCSDNTRIRNEYFEREQLEELYEISQRIGSSFEYFTDDYKVSNCYSKIASYDFNSAGCDVILCKDVYRHMNNHICQCAFSSDRLDATKLLEKISDEEKQRYCFTHLQDLVIDISLKDANKKRGVEDVLKDMGISFEQCATIGDGENDAPMLEAAAFSGCVDNGTPAAKKAAKTIVAKDSEGGVAQFINQVLLK